MAGPLTHVCANGRAGTKAGATVRIRTKVRKVSPFRAHARPRARGGPTGVADGAERIVAMGEGMRGLEHEPARQKGSFFVLGERGSGAAAGGLPFS